MIKFVLSPCIALFLCTRLAAAVMPGADDFTMGHCADCHDDLEKKGGLDLTNLDYNPTDANNFAEWVKIYDRVQAGEMPPKKAPRPPPGELRDFLTSVAATLTAEEQTHDRERGRATVRRLNRYEYENALRDLLHDPMLQVKDQLPEDGEAYRYNKLGEALDVSHVQMSRFMKAADYSLREVLSAYYQRPPTAIHRYYARDQSAIVEKFSQSFFDPYPDRGTTPLIGLTAQPEVHARRAPLTVGDGNPAIRNQEAIGWVHSYYVGAFNPFWNEFSAPVTGRYRIRFSGYTIWAAPGGYRRDFVHGEHDTVGVPMAPQWYLPNLDDIHAGRRSEPITVYARGPVMRRLGGFDLQIKPSVIQLDDLWLLRNESILTDASRFFRSRPTPKDGQFTNPLAQPDGQPGVAFRWIEVEGPLYNADSDAGYRALFDDLPLSKAAPGAAGIEVETSVEHTGTYMAVEAAAAPKATLHIDTRNPREDAARLLRRFMNAAYRRPVPEPDYQRILSLIYQQFDQGRDFGESMVAGYTAVLCSPGFIYVQEEPGRLDDYALATRLALFLWNSPPDDELRQLAAAGRLHQRTVLDGQVDRLLDDPKAARFVDAFLDYWLDLRKMADSDPSSSLYPDYYLDESLTEASLDETRMYFTELVAKNRPARDIVDSDFTYVNERLAKHYGIPGVLGGAMRRVNLPAGSARGGMMTQASVLKVTANGTTTSPVIRGHFITERMLGIDTPPPPPTVPAVQPDIRGAVTIRQQLALHRAQASCASCHSKMDPAGFALESFDVLGGWRDRYRAITEDGEPAIGIGKNGFPYTFHYSLAVDSSGNLPDGRGFRNVEDFKQLLLANEPAVARNLIKQLVIYSTGAPVRFSDRSQVEKILQQTAPDGHGVRSIIHAVVTSDLFLDK